MLILGGEEDVADDEDAHEEDEGVVDDEVTLYVLKVPPEQVYSLVAPQPHHASKHISLLIIPHCRRDYHAVCVSVGLPSTLIVGGLSESKVRNELVQILLVYASHVLLPLSLVEKCLLLLDSLVPIALNFPVELLNVYWV